MTEQPAQPQPAWQWKDPTENVKSDMAAEAKRQDGLREAEGRHVRELMARDREYSEKLRLIETARLDSIRLVDVGAVQRAAEVQAAQQQALAAQVVATADAFRVSLAAALEPIQKDIRDLRDAQSRGVGGKEQVSETREVGGASRAGIGMMVGVIGGIVGVLGLILAFYLATKK